jgi:hypothetical protein
MPGCEDLWIKAGMPDVESAGRRLRRELDDSRRRGMHVVRVIHGYGSSGVGGKLRRALRVLLAVWQEEGKVGRVIPGEHWEIFNSESLTLLEDYPFLRDDPDLNRHNAGVTLVELPQGSRRRLG